MKKLLFQFFLPCLFLLLIPFAYCEEYDATVTTDSGSYTVPVEVEDGAVTQVHWPNGGDMHVFGADISEGEASGINSRGENVDVSLDAYSNPGDDSYNGGGEADE